jgi:tryptophan synthase alpha chain
MNPFKKEGKQLSIFITAGFPMIDSLAAQLLLLQEKGIDFIEVGIPFSDPLADGPVIQESSTIALQNGMHLGLLFEQLGAIKEKIHVPIVLMGYINPILRFGLDRFLVEAKNAGVKGLILPDLPYDIFVRNYQVLFQEHGIPYIPLITPKSKDEHILKVAKDCKDGFIYLVSQNATTGKDISASTDVKRFNEIRDLCGKTPLFMGFGIKSRKDVERANFYCDGAIIGSAYIRSINDKRERAFLESLQVPRAVEH